MTGSCALLSGCIFRALLNRQMALTICQAFFPSAHMKSLLKQGEKNIKIKTHEVEICFILNTGELDALHSLLKRTEDVVGGQKKKKENSEGIYVSHCTKNVRTFFSTLGTGCEQLRHSASTI